MKAAKQDLAQRYIDRIRFWEGLLEAMKPKTRIFSNITPGKDNWLATGSGKSGIWYGIVIRQHDCNVEVVIDRGKDKSGENLGIFEAFYSQRVAIEQAFGGELDWQRLEDKQSKKIKLICDIGGYKDDDKFDAIWEWIADAVIRLEKSFKPFIDQIDV